MTGPEPSRRGLLRGLAGAGLLAAAAPRRGWASRPKRVVIAGGGFGGASCALALRRFAPQVDVTVIDRQRAFVTGPFCNTVVGGLNPVAAITQNHAGLEAAGVKVMHAEIDGLDAGERRVRLADGRKIAGDRLIVAPGIGFDWAAIDGFGPRALARVPVAWPGGADALVNLRDQVRAMPDDGRVVITVPDYPYRCPPGPYERASLIAYFLAQHKPKATVQLLDAKTDFVKAPLFRAGWAQRYPGRIRWLGRADGARAVAVDVAARRVHTAGGDTFAADVLNIIPPQRAGRLAVDAGLTDSQGWVPVHPHDFSVTGVPGVHALGDAAHAPPLPKSGYAANMQANICAIAIAHELAGEKIRDTILLNACYSLIAPDYGISVVDVYVLNGDNLAALDSAGGISALKAGRARRAAEAAYARSWYANIVRASFG